MDFSKVLGLPFLSRELLKFGRGASFELLVVSQANAAVTLSIRAVDKEGISKFAHTTVNTGQLTTTTHKISDVPLAVSIKDDVGDRIQGDVYVTLSLRINGEIVHELASGLVYSQKALTFPLSNGNDAMPGRGRIREVTGTNPAAGEEISDNVPAGRIWHILAVSFQLVTDATVANRRVVFETSGNGGWFTRHIASIDQAASVTRAYSVAKFSSITDADNGNNIQIGLAHDIYIPESGFLVTSTTNLQAGDNFTAPVYLIEEFFANPD